SWILGIKSGKSEFRGHLNLMSTQGLPGVLGIRLRQPRFGRCQPFDLASQPEQRVDVLPELWSGEPELPSNIWSPLQNSKHADEGQVRQRGRCVPFLRSQQRFGELFGHHLKVMKAMAVLDPLVLEKKQEGKVASGLSQE